MDEGMKPERPTKAERPATREFLNPLSDRTLVRAALDVVARLSAISSACGMFSREMTPQPHRQEGMVDLKSVGHRDKKFVYHMTSVENLPTIVEHGLLCRNDLIARDLLKVDVADPAILDSRGELANLVPFHFMTRNPFDYGVVRKPEHQDRRFVYVAVYRSYASATNWKVIPKHPLANGDQYQLLDWGEGIGAIEWDELDKKGNWDTDHNCKQACMAEALSPEPVPSKMIASFFFKTDADAVKAKTILPPNAWVKVNPRMFPGDK